MGRAPFRLRLEVDLWHWNWPEAEQAAAVLREILENGQASITDTTVVRNVVSSRLLARKSEAQ